MNIFRMLELKTLPGRAQAARVDCPTGTSSACLGGEVARTPRGRVCSVSGAGTALRSLTSICPQIFVAVFPGGRGARGNVGSIRNAGDGQMSDAAREVGEGREAETGGRRLSDAPGSTLCWHRKRVRSLPWSWKCFVGLSERELSRGSWVSAP